MKTKDRPLETHSAVINSFLDYAGLDEKEREILRSELKKYIEDRILRKKWCHPMITKFHTDWYRELYNMVDRKDPYRELKEKSNEISSRLLKQLTPKDIKEILLLTIIGNKIDFGMCLHGVYDITTLEKDIQTIQQQTLDIDDSTQLLERIKNAENIFFLFDNNGEMIFDTLLLDYIKQVAPQTKIFLVAKESPMVNDVTVQDLKTYNLERYGTIISTGSNCFGLHEEDVSDEFKELFKTADLVIAKGQAYFEFFSEYNFHNVFNILRVKQEIIGPNIPTLKPGMNVVMNSSRYAAGGVSYKWE